MKTKKFCVFLFLTVASVVSLAAPRTVILDVQKMTCAVCPLTVKKALEKVPGVKEATIDYANKTATVQFDDVSITSDKLTGATTAAGYPSTIRSQEK